MKLLIVDDEAHIRKGLQMGVPWKDCGIQEVRTASNGMEALQIIQNEGADILLTDIRMPGMDGLSLIQAALEVDKAMKIVVFSGFSDFDYARRSISLGVKAYLLKPVKIPELKTIVCDLVAEITAERNEEALRQRMEMEQELSHQLLKEAPEEELLQQLLGQFGLEGEDLYCVLFEADTKEEYKSRQCQLQAREMAVAIAPEADCLIPVRQQLLWIRKVGIGPSRWELQNKLERMMLERKKAADWDSTTMSAGISEVFSPEQLPQAFRQSRQLLNCRLYLGGDKIVTWEQEQKQGRRIFHIEEINRLRQYIIDFEMDGIQTFITDVFRSLKDARVSSYNLVKNTCLQLQQILFMSIDEIGIDIEHFLEGQDRLRLVVPDYITLEEYCRWVREQYAAMLRELQGWGRLPISNTVRKAVAYIQTNYHENISVDFISSYVGASRTYFSHKFKKEMQMSFTDYLNKIRIEKACRLLKTTLDTADEISRQVGFQDGRYFSTVFKKIMGCSPSSYRKNGAARAEGSE